MFLALESALNCCMSCLPRPLNLTDFTLYCFLLVSDLTFFCSPFSFLFSLLLVDFLYKSLSWQCNANWKGSLMAKLIIDECRHAPLQSPPFYSLMLRPLLVFCFLLWSSLLARFYLLLTTAVAFVCMCVWECVCVMKLSSMITQRRHAGSFSQLSSHFRFKNSSFPATKLCTAVGRETAI